MKYNKNIDVGITIFSILFSLFLLIFQYFLWGIHLSKSKIVFIIISFILFGLTILIIKLFFSYIFCMIGIFPMDEDIKNRPKIDILFIFIGFIVFIHFIFSFIFIINNNNDYKYILKFDGVEIINYTGIYEEITIPEKYLFFNVVSIRNGALNSNNELSKITFPKTLKRVGGTSIYYSPLLIFNSKVNIPQKRLFERKQRDQFNYYSEYIGMEPINQNIKYYVENWEKYSSFYGELIE